MTVPKEMRRYLVHFDLGAADMARLQEVVPRILDAIARFAGKDQCLAYRSASRDTFGYFVKTDLVAPQIRSRFTATKNRYAPMDESDPSTIPVLGHNDKVLVVEIGKDFDAAQYMSAVEPWLRHH